ncbi:hypothetical protein [Enterococcus sp. AZ109]|uniref:hypothetical protein n=1 Tax=Enterococcus sp. AZ109 TaxID=2774634 RepID=UPI003F1FF2D2
MRYLVGCAFLLLAFWQLVSFRRAFIHLKTEGNADTSPFIMLGLWNGLAFGIGFLIIAFCCFFIDLSNLI